MCDVSVEAIEHAASHLQDGIKWILRFSVILSSSSQHADCYSIPSLASRIQEKLKSV